MTIKKSAYADFFIVPDCIKSQKVLFFGMKGVLGGNHQGFPLNCDNSLKIEAEPCSARFLFLAALPPQMASACRKTDQREVFLQAEGLYKTVPFLCSKKLGADLVSLKKLGGNLLIGKEFQNRQDFKFSGKMGKFKILTI